MTPIIPGKETRYWAAYGPESIGQELTNKLSQVSNLPLSLQVAQRHARAYGYYYGLDPSGIHTASQVMREGMQGEIAAIKVNHSRALVRTLRNLITENPVAWMPKATAFSSQSIKECELAAAILEYYFSEGGVQKSTIVALENALVFAEGFVYCYWDENKGDDVAALDGQFINSGDICFESVSPWDVIRDPTKSSWDAQSWIIIRKWTNKYDLAAEYPEQADAIMRCQPYSDVLWANKSHLMTINGSFDIDDIPVYYFYHKRTSAIPTGRFVKFLHNNTVLLDDTFQNREFTLFRVTADELIGTPYGYTQYLDILGVQEVLDSLHTSVTTNQSTFATQMVALPDDAEIGPEDIGGLRVIKYNAATGAKPEAIQLTSTPPEVFRYISELRKEQQLLIGVNDVARGETPSGETSGSALALLNEQVKRQSSSVQGSYLRLLKVIGTYILETLKEKVTIERIVPFAGEGNRYLLSDLSFTGKNLSNIRSVTVELGNALTQTPQGRFEQAKELAMMLQGQINPLQVIQVLKTGRLDPLTKSLQSQLTYIQQENERLSNGEMVQVLPLDDHLLHVREHRSVLDDVAVRDNPKLVQAVLNHILEHQSTYYSVDPGLLMIAGMEPPPMMPMPGAPPSEPNQPLPSAPGGNPDAGQPSNLPELPTIAGTDQQAQPVPPPMV